MYCTKFQISDASGLPYTILSNTESLRKFRKSDYSPTATVPGVVLVDTAS